MPRDLDPAVLGEAFFSILPARLRLLFQETIAAHHASYTQGRTRDLIDAYLHEVKAHQSEGVESTFTGRLACWPSASSRPRRET